MHKWHNQGISCTLKKLQHPLDKSAEVCYNVIVPSGIGGGRYRDILVVIEF